MNSKEKVMIYPFDIECMPLLRYQELLDIYQLEYLISPRGWGTYGHDASLVDYGPGTDYKTSDNFLDNLKKCDTVIFSESNNELDFKDMIKPKILSAAKNGKNIINTYSLKNDFKNLIKKLCDEQGKYYRDIKPLFTTGDIKGKITNHKIYDINTPIIFVMGISERTSKFYLQLSLRKNILKRGYKVSQIGSKNYCELFSFYSFPQIMFEGGLTESEKIVFFNHFVKNIELKEKPDIFIIGVPGGIIPFNNEFTNYFGITAFEVSRAVVPDAVIFSILYNEYKTDYFEFLSASMKEKYGYGVDCFNISNCYFESASSAEEKRLMFSTLDYKFINNKINLYRNISSPIYNILNPDEGSKIADYIEELLSEVRLDFEEKLNLKQ